MAVEGFLNLDKPMGLTSHDCVARVRRLLRQKRVGHGGTLDPAATGVLPIAIGRATRLLQYLRQDKAYRATVRFGVRTTTDDLEGDVLSAQPAPELERAAIQALLPKFEGTIQQIPPSYSAIQVGGKRLYQLARAGEAVEAPVRTVEIFRIQLLDWRSQDYPEVDLEIACGAGTYIRSIARDLGDLLGVGGTLASLRRTASHGFPLAESIPLETLAAQLETQTFQPVPPEQALAHLPAIALPPEFARRWCMGQRLLWQPTAPEQTPLRVHDEAGTFLGIGRSLISQGEAILVPTLVFQAEG